MTFKDEANDRLPELNEIDAQTYFYLAKARKKAYEIVQNRDKHISDRLKELLEYGKEVQKDLEEYKEGDDDIDFFEVFNNPEVINQQWVEKVKTKKKNPLKTKSSMSKLQCTFYSNIFLQLFMIMMFYQK